MRITIINFLLTLTNLICIAYGVQNYELVFLDENIFKPCEDYPDKNIDELIDFSNARFEQTEDGSLVVQGYFISKTSITLTLPAVVEIFKKTRGTWQPTFLTLKRFDFCKALFDESEGWHPYLKNTPKEQQKCPITEGQRYDFDISGPTIMPIPMKNAEGEFKIHIEIGHKTTGLLVCLEIFAMAYKA